MIKRFCDVCGDDITAYTTTASISDSSQRGAHLDLCHRCAEPIWAVFERLKPGVERASGAAIPD